MLVEVLRRRAVEQGDRPSLTWQGREEGDVCTWTFADLDRQARRVAASLQRSQPPGTRVLLMCEPGLDYIAAFLGCLYARVVPVPAYPPSPWMLGRTIARLEAIATDAKASLVLTTSTALPLIEAAGINVEVGGRRLAWQCADIAPPGDEESWESTPIAAEDLAFLQYTSGSTANPKGVMVTHGNLAAQLDLILSAYEGSRGFRGVSWLPPYHDMGLVGGVLTPIWIGEPGVLLSPETFLRHPIRWLSAVSEHRADFSAAPDFAYELCVRRTTTAERAKLDLSSWRVAINGAEPVRPATIEHFVEVFAPFGFSPEHMWPSYGMAETTLLVATGALGRNSSIFTADADALETGVLVDSTAGARRSRRLVSCGTAPHGSRVIIADPGTGEGLADGRIGEIWVSGPHASAGYWGRAAESVGVFDGRTPAGEGPFVRTGDLGAIRQGELVVTGRLKDLVVIRGRNHYPQDLELTAEGSHPDVRPGAVAAFSVTGDDGSDQLAIVLECQAAPNNAFGITDAVSRAVLREHDIKPAAVVVVSPRSIPKTSSGKIQRRATRDALLSGDLSVVHEQFSPRWRPPLH